MSQTLEKLRPDHDLQCYFFHPSAIAALSGTSANGFTLSGTWRQQFDWAVVEWNRDNVFEHPSFRNLPDGDMSGLTLTYEEVRSNCIPLDSDLFPTVDWPTLRIWADDGSGEKIYKIPLKDRAVAIEGAYSPATAEVEPGGTVTPGDVVGFAFLDEHYSYQTTANPLDFAVQNLVDGVNAFSPTMVAVQTGTKIQLSYVGGASTGRRTIGTSTTGDNGNRLGLYTYVSGSQTEHWDAAWKQFSGGTSPTKWRVTLPFGSLVDPVLGPVPARSIRKMRWTYAAGLQPGTFARSEFAVGVSNWSVTGTGRQYSVAGPGSRRLNDDSADAHYSGAWTTSQGNFSGGTIHFTTVPGASVQCRYSSAQTHSLYLGTRMALGGATIRVSVDSGAPVSLNVSLPGEDVLFRSHLGELGAGDHTVLITHSGATGTYVYFDFLEMAIPATQIPSHVDEPSLTLATDWDTDHAIALAPERTAWIIDSLGFKGRVNHYAGALWFYELVRNGHQYAAASISFSGTPDANSTVQVYIGRTGQPLSMQVAISHLNLIGDTSSTVAKAFELAINNGYTAIWAQAAGSQLTITSRSMGLDGNAITIGVSVSTASFTTSVSGPTLSGGVDGLWQTDLAAMPRVNRAARDWTRSFCAALKSYGQSAVATAFSMEIQHGDPSLAAGIAQRYPSKQAVTVTTPALETNFSPQSTDFWKQAYLDLAQAQADAGLTPYLQFGEVQWWYFADGDHSGMPFYDDYTLNAFRSKYGRDMRTIVPTTDPATVPEEAAFLPSLIGQFTNAIIAFVQAKFPTCRFEVLYPTDVNDTALNRVINYPDSDWTSDKLTCLKTESFTYTFNRNLDLSKKTIHAGEAKGFPSSKRSHLVGIEDPIAAWLKEARMAESNRFDSVVLFALDQFCLVGYPLPLSRGSRRSLRLG